jgi:hypothetical protein
MKDRKRKTNTSRSREHKSLSYSNFDRRDGRLLSMIISFSNSSATPHSLNPK